jgi:hypothetical protein
MQELSKALSLSNCLVQKTDTLQQFMAEGHGPEIGLKAADVDQEELWMGTEVELEHTKDRRLAAKIAMDHFAEFPKGGYYFVLAILEKFLKSIDKLPQDRRKRMIKDLGKVVEQFVLSSRGKAEQEETSTESTTDTSSPADQSTEWYSKK